jgi:hypothetical protein
VSVVVEKGVPFPTGNGLGRTSDFWPAIRTMEVGESFVATGKSSGSLACRATRQERPKKFICRKVDGGHRVWRVA